MQKIYYNNISFLKIIFTLQILYGHIIQYFIMYQKEFNKFEFEKITYIYNNSKYKKYCRSRL